MSADSYSGVENKNAFLTSRTVSMAANGAAQTHHGRRTRERAEAGSEGPPTSSDELWVAR